MSDLIRRTLRESITIETVQAGGVWSTLVDANQLENCLLNLAVNARDAMPDGGKLTIEAANVVSRREIRRDARTCRPDNMSGSAVSDTGVGMAPEVWRKAFDPFFTTKDEGQGTGLGLSQVYGFVKQSGGHVKIYSEVGAGTTIKIYLPRLLASDSEPKTSQLLPAFRKETERPFWSWKMNPTFAILPLRHWANLATACSTRRTVPMPCEFSISSRGRIASH